MTFGVLSTDSVVLDRHTFFLQANSFKMVYRQTVRCRLIFHFGRSFQNQLYLVLRVKSNL
ncbi:hypothetical protein TTRE_0000492201 [Trichuris trichiura]|uniref:Uncharacterized protein n=1 Tax=Trichuris trichiura TaxID=36087 RepID=A0A077ZDG6_TRITR|nr:hypothetical protein TTRE_0000492201 [Trichuris trichiura]